MGGTAFEVHLEKKEATRRLGVKHQFDLAGRVPPTMV
jgi:hypothetical protein